MNTRLFSVGYQNVTPDALKAIAEKYDAIIADIRYSPKSTAPQWRQESLRKFLTFRYIHLFALGNRNYKYPEKPFDIVSPDVGMQAIREMLKKRSVIMMCACWNLISCHRLEVAKIAREKLKMETHHLTRQEVRAALNPSLFDEQEQDDEKLPFYHL